MWYSGSIGSSFWVDLPSRLVFRLSWILWLGESFVSFDIQVLLDLLSGWIFHLDNHVTDWSFCLGGTSVSLDLQATSAFNCESLNILREGRSTMTEDPIEPGYLTRWKIHFDRGSNRAWLSIETEDPPRQRMQSSLIIQRDKTSTETEDPIEPEYPTRWKIYRDGRSTVGSFV